jgi:polar amino acid transport system substrate-binding protein
MFSLFSRPAFLRSAAAAGLLIATTLSLTALQGKDLRLVSTVWPPFTNTAGQPRFALDLVEAALDRSGAPSATTFVDNAQFTSAITTGPFDGSGAAWRDAARETALVFSQPYLENRLILVARRGGNVSAQTLTALKGRRLGIVEGYAYGDELARSGATLVGAKSEEEGLRLLLDSKVDYALMDALVVQHIVESYPEEARTRLQIGTAPLLTRSLHLAIRRSRPDAESIIQRFNSQLRAMITDRTYHRLLHVDWIRADVDGDGVAEYVAGSDRSGKQPPQYAYPLFSSAAIEKQVKNQERYFFGGAVYNGWSSVPDHYKVDDLGRTDPQHPTARIFTFSWK